MIKRFGLLILLCFCLTGLAHADQKIRGRGMSFTAMPSFTSRGNFGYNYFPVMAVNHSSQEKVVNLSIQADYSSELGYVSRTFSVPAGETRVEAIFFPILGISSRGIKIEVDNMTLNNALGSRISSYRGYHGSSRGQSLVDAKISRNDFNNVFQNSYGSSGRADLETNYFEGGYEQFAPNWMAYSQYDNLVFFADSLKKMRPSARNAIFDYVRTGGTLLVLGNIDLPGDFEEEKLIIKDSNEIKKYLGGFGQLFKAEENFLEKVATSTIDPIPNFASDRTSSMSGRYGIPLEFSDNEIESVSAKWLMILIYAFAFLIGPVNVYILHKIQRKIWVFVTVPVASAVCCLLIFGYYLIFESSTVILKQGAITILDERFNRAITHGGLAVFSSSSKPEGLKFDLDTEVIPLEERTHRNRGRGLSIILHNGQNFRDGWIRAKIPGYFHLRRVQTRRERIELQESNGQKEILNGLGAEISKIFLMTNTGEILVANNVEAGSRSMLSDPGPIRPGGRKNNLSDLFSKNWYEKKQKIKSGAIKFLKPGMYVAILKGAPFLDNHNLSDADLQEESAVIGIMSQGEKK
jgi:hypothetical protein